MNPIFREHLISATQTFVASFLLALGTSISLGGIEWTSSFIVALLLSAARAAIKEVFAKFAPIAFGGRKGKTAFGHRK